MDVVLIVLILVLVGYFSKVFDILKEEHAKILNNIVIYIAMPSTIFLTILKNPSSQILNFLKLPLVIFISCLFVGILAYIVGKYFFKLKDEKLGALILVSMLGNTGFLGYPVCLGMFGEAGLARAIFCDLGGVFATMLLGTYVGIKFGKSKNKSVLKEMAKFPPLIIGIFTIILALLGFKLEYLPNFILKSLNYLSSATVPLIMMSLGLSLSPRALRFGVFWGILVSILRFVVSPASAITLAELINIKGLDRDVLLIESSMPSAMMSLVLGTLYELDIKLIASSIFITTALSLIVIGVWEIVI
ncbi:AEC family transporter [Methanocaldococcus fervens]|uniref:Auxin efflux carrier n=1 Tax=Methanocaldococcus fervens (strain DSM 4213 / JCM 15782 / AG86) TaxID=573064 RepID=C7P5X8_METFA|nr:AEC family transporter [Methanocaldococcus fervens]ACV23960.1 auxin efflux carrier [Methanocaldococcus fervens AG86]